jgi:MYXO-CTERM domain-containing protein
MSKCEPGSIDCKAMCHDDCSARCNSECSLDDCSAQCDASCTSECATSCTATAPTCATSCDASCNGSCNVQANINCDVDCYSNLEGGCKTKCEDPSGALFCNDQYVETSDLDACINYIKDNLHGEVDVSARGEVTCDLANGCESSGSTTGCSIGDAGAAAGGAGALAGLGLALGAVIRRRKRAA